MYTSKLGCIRCFSQNVIYMNKEYPNRLMFSETVRGNDQGPLLLLHTSLAWCILYFRYKCIMCLLIYNDTLLSNTHTHTHTHTHKKRTPELWMQVPIVLK